MDSRAWPGGPKLAISATLAPLDTERHFLLVHMNIRHAGWTEEQVQACGETPSVPAGATDVELAQLAAYDAFQARFEGREAVEEAAQRALELDPNCADAYTVLWLMEWEDSPQVLQLALQANMASLATLGDRPPGFRAWGRPVDRLSVPANRTRVCRPLPDLMGAREARTGH